MSFLLKSIIRSPILRNPILRDPVKSFTLNSFTLNSLTSAIRAFSISTPLNNKKKCPPKKNCKMGTCPGKRKQGLKCAPKIQASSIVRPKGSVWESPECNKLPCPNPYPKFDSLYPKKQFASKVMQTWVACPKRRTVKKVLCKYKTKKYPPLPKRQPGCIHQKSACADAGNTDLMKCQAKNMDLRCIKINMPGCGKARNPPSCKIGRKRLKCKKKQCPWKCFSECDKPPPNRKRPTECGCTDVRPMCEIYMIAKKKGYLKK